MYGTNMEHRKKGDVPSIKKINKNKNHNQQEQNREDKKERS